jgi:three-Cys-motif partner protein
MAVEGWFIIGLNAQLFGSDFGLEADQWRWFGEWAGMRPVALMLHKPLFQNTCEDEVPHIRYVPLGPRRRLLNLIARLDVRIVLSGHAHQYLDRIIGGIRHIWVPSHTGDSNEYLTKQLLPTIHYKNFNRALCLLDPYGLHLDWEVIFEAGKSRAVDMFLNFPVMDMNRNAIWRNPEKVPPAGVERMTRFWGDDSWEQAAYAVSRQGNLFGPERVKQSNEEIVSAFKKRLKKVAGFAFVPEPLEMRNSTKAVIYYLFFASQKPVAEKIISDIFSKYR